MRSNAEAAQTHRRYERSARRGRNLRTGESLKIPAIRAVRFRIGKRLRDAAAGSKRKRAGKS
jgi:DNA-binding protein HU-beta